MYQKASKSIQNELCKCFVYEITKEVFFITIKVAKIDKLLLSLRCGKPCICFQSMHYTPYFKDMRQMSGLREI